MSVFIRSSDVILGLPYDVMCYALTLDAIAMSVGCKSGTISFTLAHPHIYEPYFELAQECLVDPDTWISNTSPKLPGWNRSAIINDPDMYIDVVRLNQKVVNTHTFNPQLDVIE